MALNNLLKRSGLASLLTAAALSSATLAPKDAAAQVYAQVRVTASQSGAPITGAYVGIDIDPLANDGIELERMTDNYGIAMFEDVVHVEDPGVTPVVPNPDGSFTLVASSVYNNGSSSPLVKFSARNGQSVTASMYDARGRLVASDRGVDDLSLDARLPQGVYFTLLSSDTGRAAHKVINPSSGLKVTFDRQSLEEAVANGYASKSANKLDPSESMLVNVFVTKEGFQDVDMPYTITGGILNDIPVEMSVVPSDYDIRFRVTDGSADAWMPGLTLNLRGPDGRVFSGVSGADGNLTVSVPQSYASNDSFKVFISNTPGFSHNVYGMIAWPNCVDKIASTDGEFCVKQDTASVALDQIVGLTEGVGFVPLPDSMYENLEFREMADDVEQGTGNRDYAYGDVTFWNYTLDFTSSLPIAEFRRQLQRDAINFYVPQFTRGTGLNIANVNVIESDTFPNVAEGYLFVFQRNNTGPGNIRGPPGDGQMTYGYAFTEVDNNRNTLISEIGSLVGLADNSVGSTNLPGFVSSNGEITGFSEKGKHLMVYWGTHGTNDGAGGSNPGK